MTKDIFAVLEMPHLSNAYVFLRYENHIINICISLEI